MNEARVGIGAHDHLYALLDLGIVLRGERLHHDRHWPSHVVAYMRATNAFAVLAFEEVRIVLAPHKAAGVLVDGVVDVDITEVRHSEQRRNVGIVHEEMVAEAVNLVSVDLAILGVVDNSIFLQSGRHLVGEGCTLGCCGGVVVYLGQDLSGLTQRRDSHEVGWHKEQERGSIVRGTEHRGDKTYGIHRVAIARVADGVELTVGLAKEGVRTLVLLALLFVEGFENLLHSLLPFGTKHRGVARYLPVVEGETDGIAQRVDLILALMQFRLHVGAVACPLVVLYGTHVEGVGIGVDVDALELTQDDAAHHLLKLSVFVAILHIGPNLSAAVAEPHGVDVASVDESVVLAVKMGGGVDGVGEAVLKHPCQVSIVLEKLLHLFYFLFHSV